MGTPPATSELENTLDYVYYEQGDKVYRAWEPEVFSRQSVSRLEAFVTDCVPGRGPARLLKSSNGSYNMAFMFGFVGDRPEVVLRTPKPGHTVAEFMDEKVLNEVRWMEFLRECTDIPIPRIHSWGPGAQSPELIGPFIIMDFVQGQNLHKFLSSCLKKPDGKEWTERVYVQVARFHLQLSRLPFDRIGAISKDDASGAWSVTGRPLTFGMHQLALGIPHYPTDHYPTGPLARVSDYFKFVTTQQQTQLWNQYSINKTVDIARYRFQARDRFEQLIPQFCSDEEGPFLPYLEDFRAGNMLVDPETCRITGVIDLEYMNAMPAQFAYDPPSWLKLVRPDDCLNNDWGPWFVKEYEPLLMRFLKAMERVEDEKESSPSSGHRGPRLSARMRQSWATWRFWFDFAACDASAVDSVYWGLLRKVDVNFAMPPEKEAEMERYVKFSKGQKAKFEAAKKEYRRQRQEVRDRKLEVKTDTKSTE